MDAICHWRAVTSAPVVFSFSFFLVTSFFLLLFFIMFPLLPACLSGEKSASVISDIYSCDGSRKGESHIRAAGNSKASGNWSFVFINCFSRWRRRRRLIKLTSPLAWRTNVWWPMLLSPSKSSLPLKFIVKATRRLVKKVVLVQKKQQTKKTMWLAWFL